MEFYFWYAGSELQKSHEGLLSGILHSIFSKCPGLLPSVVPRRWNKLASTEDMKTDIWNQTELSQALQAITALGSLGYRFRLFLDGLDEYSGEHRELVADLRALASNTCIKICVSSLDHHPGCLFTHDWNEIYQFLVANGKCSAILEVARTHDLL